MERLLSILVAGNLDGVEPIGSEWRELDDAPAVAAHDTQTAAAPIPLRPLPGRNLTCDQMAKPQLRGAMAFRPWGCY